MKARTLLLALAAVAMFLTGWAGGLTTGEGAVNQSGSPSMAGQPTVDHLFVRGTYDGTTCDNLVAFDEGATKLVWLWLDDDAIYNNAKVQSLTPIPYNRAGDLYNEITYNSFQCDIYLPEGVSLVGVENEDGDIISYVQGDRMPNSSACFYQQNGTKTVDGVTYMFNYHRLIASFHISIPFIKIPHKEGENEWRVSGIFKSACPLLASKDAVFYMGLRDAIN